MGTAAIAKNGPLPPSPLFHLDLDTSRITSYVVRRNPVSFDGPNQKGNMKIGRKKKEGACDKFPEDQGYRLPELGGEAIINRQMQAERPKYQVPSSIKTRVANRGATEKCRSYAPLDSFAHYYALIARTHRAQRDCSCLSVSVYLSSCTVA